MGARPCGSQGISRIPYWIYSDPEIYARSRSASSAVRAGTTSRSKRSCRARSTLHRRACRCRARQGQAPSTVVMAGLRFERT